MIKIFLYVILIALCIGCAGPRGFDSAAGFKFDIQPVIQLGHSGAVNTVAISPDDRFTVSGSADGTIKIWEVSTGRLIYTINHRLDEKGISTFKGGEVQYNRIALSTQINCIDISADGRMLLAGSSDGNAVVTEIKTGKTIQVYRKHSKSINAVVLSKDGNLAVTAEADGDIHFWQTAGGRTIHKFNIKFCHITAIDISPNDIILVGDSEGIVRLINPAAGHAIQILGKHDSPISAVKFSMDGRMAVSGGGDGSVKLWGVNPRCDLPQPERYKSNVIAIGFNRDSNHIMACYADGTLKLSDTRSRLLKSIRIAHAENIHAAAFSADHRFIITAGHDRKLKRSWISTGGTINSFEGRSSRIHSVVFSPDGRLLLSSMRGQINCWDMTTGVLRQIFRANLYKDDLENIATDHHPLSMNLSSVGFSPDGLSIVSRGIDGTYHAWSLATGKEIDTSERFATKLSTVAYSPDKRYYARGTRVIIVRETSDDRVVHRLDGHEKWITAIAYSPDGQFILSGDVGGNLILWNVLLGLAIKKFSGHSDAVTSIDFSPAGRLVATGSWDNSCRIWDIASGQEIVKCIASPDGEWITSTPEGFYINSPEGHNLIHWSVPKELETYSFEQFESKFKRPDLIEGRLYWNQDIKLAYPAITKPPRIEISNQDEIKTIQGKKYLVQISSSDTHIIETLRIFVNGKPVHEIKVAPNQTRFNVSVPLDFGVNRITAVAYDSRGFSSNPKFIDVISNNPELHRPNLHISAIGISHYVRMGTDLQLDYAHSDAEAIIAAFKRQEGKIFGAVSDNLLVNERATADAILENVCSLDKNGEVDISIIFMAGHGIKTSNGEYYFLGYNGTFDKPKSGGLNWIRLKDCLSHAKGRVILFLDACHSGSITNETVVPNDEMAHQFFSGERAGIMVFAASKGRQYAMESPDIGGGFGLFTWALTQGLGPKSVEADVNGNQVVEFLELVSFVERYVSELTDGDQTPWLSRKELFGDFPLAVVK